MCGFLISFKTTFSEKEFKSAFASLQHRGPDFSKILNVNGVMMGHHRLSIIDLSDKSNQPIMDNNKRYTMVYNGEIFNYKELRLEYNLPAVISDTELVLQLYIKLGMNFVKKLNGMFAIVIYDSEADKIIIARDRFGIKPLYYYNTGNGFVLASEISPLLQLSRSEEVDTFSVRQLFKMRGLKMGKTLFRGISEFPPAHFSYGAAIAPQRYWSITFGDRTDVCDEEFSFVLENAIKRSTVADVSYDCMLSGGLDSSLIASLTEPKNTWIIGSKSNNEFPFAELVARRKGLNLVQVLYEDNEFIQRANKVLEKTMYPVFVPNEILIDLLSEKIKESSKVLLCGEGADELFLGYDRIFRYFLNKKINIEDFDRLYCYSDCVDFDVIEDAAEDLLAGDICALRKFFAEFHLPTLLKRVDQSTMRHGVEARVPFLDNELAELAFSMDASVAIDNFDSKKPLKDYVNRTQILPREIVERKKIGFPVSFSFEIDDNKKLESYKDWFEYNLTNTKII